MATRHAQEIAEDLKNVEFETSEDVEVTPTFDAMGLREDLLRGVYSYGEAINDTLPINNAAYICCSNATGRLEAEATIESPLSLRLRLSLRLSLRLKTANTLKTAPPPPPY